jgi:hypothetical protein
MEVQFNDGGRAAAGYKGSASDCVVRAICIATDRPYQEIYDYVNKYVGFERKSKKRTKSSSRTGIRNNTTKKIMKDLGFEWTPTMTIGSGCKVHLKADELPNGRIIANVSKHVVAVIDGVIYDTHDPSRNETRCVYGYWRLP